jgi:protein-tyrosine-phosphatase
MSTSSPIFGGWRGALSHRIKPLLKKLLPVSILREVGAYRAYAPDERSIYAKLRLRNAFGLSKSRRIAHPETTRSIVFVCFGNIMRSPAAEEMTKRALARFPDLSIEVTSAGLNATPGRAAHPWAIEAGHELGISLEHHQARIMTAELVARADIIFAMDYQNLVQLQSRWKESEGKVFMLAAYAGNEHRGAEIRDPYYIGLEETKRCYGVLDACVHNLVTSFAMKR